MGSLVENRRIGCIGAMRVAWTKRGVVGRVLWALDEVVAEWRHSVRFVAKYSADGIRVLGHRVVDGLRATETRTRCLDTVAGSLDAFWDGVRRV